MVKGSCLCGNIKYQVEIDPGKILNCHCKFCRKAHGADYATMAIVDASTLKMECGNEFLKEHKSGAGGYRAFCSECGTRLMNYGPDKITFFCVAISTIDTPLNVKPVAHINTESKAAWCTPCEGVPQFTGFPDAI